MLTKPYLFGILNTLDPTFFDRLLQEVGQKLPSKAKKEEVALKIDPDMFEMIKLFSEHAVGSINSRSLATVNLKHKKRTRK